MQVTLGRSRLLTAAAIEVFGKIMENSSGFSADQIVKRFDNPPVLERVVTVTANMDEELYISRIESWKALIAVDFPVYAPLTEWRVHIEQQNGQSVIDPTKGNLILIPRSSKKSQAQGFDWSLRCPRGALTINMHSDPKLLRSYDDLKQSFETWLPKWMAHFDVERIENIQLRYVNIITAERMPDFAVRPDEISLDRILSVFVNIPGYHKLLIPPLNCIATVLLESDRSASLQLHLTGIAVPTVGARLDIATDVLVADGSINTVSQLLDWSHDRILERFRDVFTEEARQSFGPMP